MIDKLEKGGVLSPADAKEARKTMKKNLEGGNANIIDKASEKGVDVNIFEPDGNTIQVKTNGASLGAKGIVDIQSINTSEAKTFNPNTNDRTGESILKSKVDPQSTSSSNTFK